MNKNISTELEDLGYKIKERKFEGRNILQCSAPDEDKDFQIRGFGIEILNNDEFIFWDGRDQIPNPIQFPNSDELIQHITSIFPLDSNDGDDL